jgi:hypothetical protein
MARNDFAWSKSSGVASGVVMGARSSAKAFSLPVKLAIDAVMFCSAVTGSLSRCHRASIASWVRNAFRLRPLPSRKGWSALSSVR